MSQRHVWAVLGSRIPKLHGMGHCCRCCAGTVDAAECLRTAQLQGLVGRLVDCALGNCPGELGTEAQGLFCVHVAMSYAWPYIDSDCGCHYVPSGGRSFALQWERFGAVPTSGSAK
jgi:hypothetical protein